MAELVTSITAEVVFDASLTGEGQQPISSNFATLWISPGVASITVSLVIINNSSANTAAFANPPISTSILNPPISHSIINSTTFVLVDNNETEEQQTIPFSVLVDFGGQIFRHDPVIINEPPAG